MVAGQKMRRRCVDAVSTDHPMNLPIGRFWARERSTSTTRFAKICEESSAARKALIKLFPDDHYQLTHNALFRHNCIHAENLGGTVWMRRRSRTRG